MQTLTLIAHVGQLNREPHLLEEHLRDVAQLAALFASNLGASDWANLAGLWHDFGKYSPDFQSYIRSRSGYEAHLVDGMPGKINHSSAGALHALERLPDARGRILILAL
jgi:CRISPR-associated endonuclease/helicase Cas3